ncbi:flippase-like domain-containing protein [Candidatus Saccharibacteria bacterium]|nr:flippase-like domain-containing protein [Candidatus Saccharibacteria bacterium]
MSFRSWVTVITFILLGLVVYFAWPQISHAWSLLGQINLLLLMLVIPVQLVSYYAIGGMIFSYLRSKGNLKTTTRWEMTRMALELNFVNHIMPSGGAAGFSYLGWVLGRHGVRPGRATMAQIIRFALAFLSFIGILIIAVIALALDHQIDRIIIAVSFALTLVVIGGTVFTIHIVGSKQRLVVFSGWLTKKTNTFISAVTRGKKQQTVKLEIIENFFAELHQDYIEIRHDKKILIRPLIWALLANLADVTLLIVSFLALGVWVNPAILFIAFGISSLVSIMAVTPGGTGVYEAIMIAFLASAGVPAEIAIAGTLVARVTLLVGTVAFGYVFYQLTILKYGKNPI